MRVHVLLFLSFSLGVYGWDDGDLEVFDVVEEVNSNFYELLGVKQVKQSSCTTQTKIPS